MAGHGRKRRASDSTVGTVDDRLVRYAKELNVVKAAPLDMPSDNWPCWVLTDAVVYDKHGSLANVLHVDLEGPFRIKGFLEIDGKDQQEYLIKPNLKCAHIEIAESWSYSIGTGPVSLWASGKGGWYEIKPAAQYQQIYKKMCQGITLYYSVMEVYGMSSLDEHLKKFTPKEMELKDILGRYAHLVGDGVYHEEAVKRCHDHASFLLAHFEKEPRFTWEVRGEEQSFSWKATSFYWGIKNAHKDIVKKLKGAAQGIKPLLPAPRSPKPVSPPDPRSRSAALPVRGRGSRKPTRSASAESLAGKGAAAEDVDMEAAEEPKAETADQVASPKDEASRPSSRSGRSSLNPIEALKTLLVEIADETNPAKSAPAAIYNRIHFKCQVKKYGASKDIVSYYAKPLEAQLPAVWKGTPLHQWLQAEAKKAYTPSDMITVDEMPGQLQRRNHKGPATRTPGATAPKQKPAKTKKKQKSSWPSAAVADTDTDDQLATTSDRRVRRAGKGAGLRLLTNKGRKRLTASMDEDEESQGSRRGAKSAKTMHRAHDDMDDEVEDTNNEQHSEDDEQLERPREAVRVVMTSQRIPTMSPAGPNGTWVCSEPDCRYVVRAAEDEEGKRIVHDHIQQHERQNLAVSEGMRGRMPIEHLLEKIQRAGKQKLLAEREAGQSEHPAFPSPIKRALLV